MQSANDLKRNVVGFANTIIRQVQKSRQQNVLKYKILINDLTRLSQSVTQNTISHNRGRQEILFRIALAYADTKHSISTRFTRKSSLRGYFEGLLCAYSGHSLSEKSFEEKAMFFEKFFKTDLRAIIQKEQEQEQQQEQEQKQLQPSQPRNDSMVSVSLEDDVKQLTKEKKQHLPTPDELSTVNLGSTIKNQTVSKQAHTFFDHKHTDDKKTPRFERKNVDMTPQPAGAKAKNVIIAVEADEKSRLFTVNKINTLPKKVEQTKIKDFDKKWATTFANVLVKPFILEKFNDPTLTVSLEVLDRGMDPLWKHSKNALLNYKVKVIDENNNRSHHFNFVIKICMTDVNARTASVMHPSDQKLFRQAKMTNRKRSFINVSVVNYIFTKNQQTTNDTIELVKDNINNDQKRVVAYGRSSSS